MSITIDNNSHSHSHNNTLMQETYVTLSFDALSEESLTEPVDYPRYLMNHQNKIIGRLSLIIMNSDNKLQAGEVGEIIEKVGRKARVRA